MAAGEITVGEVHDAVLDGGCEVQEGFFGSERGVGAETEGALLFGSLQLVG